MKAKKAVIFGFKHSGTEVRMDDDAGKALHPAKFSGYDILYIGAAFKDKQVSNMMLKVIDANPRN